MNLDIHETPVPKDLSTTAPQLGWQESVIRAWVLNPSDDPILIVLTKSRFTSHPGASVYYDLYYRYFEPGIGGRKVMPQIVKPFIYRYREWRDVARNVAPFFAVHTTKSLLPLFRPIIALLSMPCP